MSLPAIDHCLLWGGPTEQRHRGWYCPYCGLHFQVQENPDVLIFGIADYCISAEERRRILENWEKLRAKHLGPDC
jgi:hypothetical protein